MSTCQDALAEKHAKAMAKVAKLEKTACHKNAKYKDIVAYDIAVKEVIKIILKVSEIVKNKDVCKYSSALERNLKRLSFY